MLILLLGNAVLYAVVMLLLYRGIRKIGGTNPAARSEEGISVIIPARNEAEVLPRTIAALLRQETEGFCWEVLLVDDDSEDGTAEIMVQAARENPRFRFLQSRGGKKRALTRGMEAARFPVVAVRDADSKPGPLWLDRLLSAFTEDTGMVLGVSRFTANGSFFQEVLQVEYAGIMGLAQGLASLGFPLFGSGANLAYRREVFWEVGGYSGSFNLASGDDTFLIQQVAKNTDWKIRPLLDAAAAVDTRPPESFRAFWRQRARWASTHGRLPDWRLTALGAQTYLLVTGILGTLAVGVVSTSWMTAGLVMLSLKTLAELPLLRESCRRLAVPLRLLVIPAGQIWQLIYIPFSPLPGLLGRFRWR